MEIRPINNCKYFTPAKTGYAAAGGITLSLITGFSKNKCIKKTHKPIACMSAILTILHIALIEYNHYKFKNKQM